MNLAKTCQSSWKQQRKTEICCLSNIGKWANISFLDDDYDGDEYDDDDDYDDHDGDADVVDDHYDDDDDNYDDYDDDDDDDDDDADDDNLSRLMMMIMTKMVMMTIMILIILLVVDDDDDDDDDDNSSCLMIFCRDHWLVQLNWLSLHHSNQERTCYSHLEDKIGFLILLILFSILFPDHDNCFSICQ